MTHTSTPTSTPPDYATQMQQFRAWLTSAMQAVTDQQRETLPTVGEAAAALGVTTEELERMCDDAQAHGFSVSLEALTEWWQTADGRRVELL